MNDFKTRRERIASHQDEMDAAAHNARAEVAADRNRYLEALERIENLHRFPGNDAELVREATFRIANRALHPELPTEEE